jgi:hypothetical protein
VYEKLISGMYLGELTRWILLGNLSFISAFFSSSFFGYFYVKIDVLATKRKCLLSKSTTNFFGYLAKLILKMFSILSSLLFIVEDKSSFVMKYIANIFRI